MLVEGPVVAAHLTEQNRDLSPFCLYSVPHDAHRGLAFFPMSADAEDVDQGWRCALPSALVPPPTRDAAGLAAVGHAGPRWEPLRESVGVRARGVAPALAARRAWAVDQATPTADAPINGPSMATANPSCVALDEPRSKRPIFGREPRNMRYISQSAGFHDSEKNTPRSAQLTGADPLVWIFAPKPTQVRTRVMTRSWYPPPHDAFSIPRRAPITAPRSKIVRYLLAIPNDPRGGSRSALPI